MGDAVRTMSENRFGIIVYKFLIAITIISIVLLLFLSFYLSPSSLLRFSFDKKLDASTINKITQLKFILFGFGGFCCLILFLIKRNKEYFSSLFERRKNVIQGVLILSVTLVLFIAAGEVFLRMTMHEGTSPYYIKLLKYYELNENGFRDNVYPYDKPNGTIRIVVIGPSTVFGSGILDVNNTFPKVLERELNLEDKRYEVLNFGNPGNLLTKYPNLTETALEYNADMIIMTFTHVSLISTDPTMIELEKNSMVAFPIVGFWLRSASYLYYYVESRGNRILGMTGMRISYPEQIKLKYSNEQDKETCGLILKNLSNTCKSNNVSCPIMVLPVMFNFEDYSYQYVEDYIHDIGNKYNISVIDPLDRFKEHKSENLIVNNYDAHPNELGHEIIAEELYTYIQSDGGRR